MKDAAPPDEQQRNHHALDVAFKLGAWAVVTHISAGPAAVHTRDGDACLAVEAAGRSRPKRPPTSVITASTFLRAMAMGPPGVRTARMGAKSKSRLIARSTEEKEGPGILAVRRA